MKHFFNPILIKSSDSSIKLWFIYKDKYTNIIFRRSRTQTIDLGISNRQHIGSFWSKTLLISAREQRHEQVERKKEKKKANRTLKSSVTVARRKILFCQLQTVLKQERKMVVEERISKHSRLLDSIKRKTRSERTKIFNNNFEQLINNVKKIRRFNLSNQPYKYAAQWTCYSDQEWSD